MKARLKQISLTTLMAVFAILMLLPFYIMVIMSTQLTEDIYKGISLIPGDYAWLNIQTVFESGFLRFYWNSFYIAVLSTLLGTVVTAMLAFSLSKYHFAGRGFLTGFVLVTMMIPTQIGLVGFVSEMRAIGWGNTHWPLIVPPAANAFNAFFLLQYMRSFLPNEVLESARIDGCGEFRSFASIAIPMVTPALITVALLFFLASWNSYLMPMVLLNKESLYTITLGIPKLGNLFRTDYAGRIMAMTLGTLPVVILFSFGSKSFARGLTAGAIKG